MKRYVGNSGLVEQIPEAGQRRPVGQRPLIGGIEAGIGQSTAPIFPLGNAPSERKPQGQPPSGNGLSGLITELGLGKSKPELEDFILIAYLYLLYRETKDFEFLLIAISLLAM